MFFSVILVTHQSYIETTDRRDFGGKPSKWRCGRKKNPDFFSVGRARSKNSIFRVFRVPFDYLGHSLQETVLPQTNGTVLFFTIIQRFDAVVGLQEGYLACKNS